MRQKILICITLSLIILTAFLPVLTASFVSLDDPEHLLKNPAVSLTSLSDIKNSFTQTINHVYLPLTTLSFAIEKFFFGFNPLIFHIDNLLLHIMTTLGIFLLAMRLGISLRAAFLAALLFGLHPMKVESVAWVTERKDVLYAFFYVLALHAYLSYVKTKSAYFYIATLCLGILSILSKAMGLSLGLILLLIDWQQQRKITLNVILEKCPFFFYSAWIGSISYLPHMRNPIVDVGGSILVWCWCFCFYLWKFFFPATVSPYYRLPEPIALSHWPYALSLLATIGITLLMILKRHNRLLLFAFAYYFLSIFFLLRFDQGLDSSVVSDRFMYLPCLGICLLVGIYADRLCNNKWLMAVIVAILLVLGTKTYRQCFIWQNSLNLWNELINKYPEGFAAYLNRGQIFVAQGQHDLAIADYTKAIELEPAFPGSYVNRGTVLAQTGKTREAMADFDKALSLNPTIAEAYFNRAIIKEKNNDFKGALADLLVAQRYHAPIPAYFLKRVEEESGKESR